MPDAPDAPDPLEDPEHPDAWVSSLLATSHPPDPSSRDAHIAAAMAAYDAARVVPIRSPRHRRTVTRLGAVAAAAVLVLSTIGVVVARVDGPDAPRDTASSDPAGRAEVDESAEDLATDPSTRFLGEFDSDADLRAALSGAATATPSTGALGVPDASASTTLATDGPAPDPTVGRAAESSATPCPAPDRLDGVEVVRASVAGEPVVAVVEPDGTVVVYDASSCTARNG